MAKVKQFTKFWSNMMQIKLFLGLSKINHKKNAQD
jgi:hypothetical protein